MTQRWKPSGRFLRWLLAPVLLLVAAAAWVALDPGFRVTRESADIVSAAPKDEFERRVREYLLATPEVIMEAVQRLEARQRVAERTEAGAVVMARAEEIFRAPDSPVGGNPDGDVTLVEFFDYNCPYCRQVTPVMREASARDKKLRIVYKEFPILGPESVFVARAALAAHRQGKYVAFHDALMEEGGRANEAKAMSAATKLGLDLERLKADMATPEIQAEIDRNLALAQALLISGTPSFVIGDQIVRGAIDLATMQSSIERARGGR